MNLISPVSMPLLVLLTGALLLLLIGRLRVNQWVLGLLALGVCLSAFGFLIALQGQIQNSMAGTNLTRIWGSLNHGGSFLNANAWSVILTAICLGIGMCIILYASVCKEVNQSYKQIMSLILLSLAGLYGLLTAGDLFTVYLFSELLCISGCAMIMINGRTENAFRAGIKYLIMGSAATLIMLLGLSLVYRENGQIVVSIMQHSTGLWARMGAACFLVGLGLKIGFVPLHGWLPDAYEHAPNPISGLLAGFISGSSLFILPGICLSLGLQIEELGLVLMLGSFINMFVGNISAFAQKNPKRVLAYSSIAYTGYLMFIMAIGLLYNQPSALAITMFFFIAHAFMKSLAFLSLGQIEQTGQTATQITFVSRMAFIVAIAGLASIPPLAGFTSKWVIILEALKTNDGLAWIGMGILLFNSLLALGYYLPMLRMVFVKENLQEGASSRINVSQIVMALVPLMILTIFVIWIGVQPTLWMRFAGLFGLK